MSNESEADFWGRNGLQGLRPSAVWGLGGQQGEGPTTIVLWGYRCCQNGNVGLRTEMEPIDTSLVLGLSFPVGNGGWAPQARPL